MKNIPDRNQNHHDGDEGGDVDPGNIRHWPWKEVGALAWILLIAIIGIRMYGQSRISPTMRKQIAKLESTKLSLPRDWHKPADLPPPDVFTFQKSFVTQMEAIRLKHELLLNGPGGYQDILKNYLTTPWTEDEQASFSVLMADLQPVIDETSQSVRIPGYTLETDLHLSETMSLLDFQTFAKIMSVVAGEQANNGKCYEAMETAMLPLRLIKRPEQSGIITHLIAIAIVNISTKSFANIIDICGEIPALRHGLQLLNDQRYFVFPGDIQYWYREEPLVFLRFAAAYGYPVDLQPQSRADFIRQYYKLFTNDYFRWIVDHFPSGDPRVAGAKESIAVNDRASRDSSFFSPLSFSSPFKREVYRLATGVDPIVAFHVGMGPDYDVAFTRTYAALARYDLTRLNFARRLVAADSSETTLTAYLSTIPEDPFTSAPFLFSPALKKDYSVGPDGRDDKTTILYDPTNGTISVGDIWM